MKILILTVILFNVGCAPQNNDLERFFDKLEEQSPPQMIKEFKKTPIDSAVIHNDRFNEIFVHAAEEILKDSIETDQFRLFFIVKGIDLNMLDGTPIYWAFIASFHKYLNHKNYTFEEVVDDMQVLSDRVNEIKYGRPDE